MVNISSGIFILDHTCEIMHDADKTGVIYRNIIFLERKNHVLVRDIESLSGGLSCPPVLIQCCLGLKLDVRFAHLQIAPFFSFSWGMTVWFCRCKHRHGCEHPHQSLQNSHIQCLKQPLTWFDNIKNNKNMHICKIAIQKI